LQQNNYLSSHFCCSAIVLIAKIHITILISSLAIITQASVFASRLPPVFIYQKVVL
jgi:hypothetical protein